uniref:UDP-glucuronosyltransferase n=1 Tax=Culicoides sonorensis TaxID=179676 RepID=A0A336N066_CULSO
MSRDSNLMKWVLNIFVFTVIFFNQCSAYRILCLFPTPATSHQIVFRAYTKALVEHGHELVVATTHPVENPHPNITQIDWSVVQKLWADKLDFSSKKDTSGGLMTLIRAYVDSMTQILDVELSHPSIKEIINNPEKQKFDLAVVENHFVGMFDIAKLLKVPLIVICSSDPNEIEHKAVGNYVHSIAAPLRIASTYGLMTFYERMSAVTFEIMFRFMAFTLEKSFRTALVKHFGPNVRSMTEMAQDIDMLFVNVNPAFGYVRPITPKTVTLGFMHITDPKPLPQDLQSYLDNSKNGVIYCSFGTNINSEKFDSGNLKSILNAFSRLKYDVLYKFGNETMKNQPKNVKLVKWAPQSDLLAHKNVKLFITQGGQHSLEEAIYREVPLLAIPFYGDQFTNAKRIAAKGLGKWLTINDIESNALYETIKEIISNPIYKENIKKLSQIVKDEPMTPTTKAVWWTEYVIRNKGAKHLEYHGVKVPSYQFYYLDVIAAYVTIILLLYFTIKGILRLCMRLINKFIGRRHTKTD